METLREFKMSSPEKNATFEKKITKQIEVIMLQIIQYTFLGGIDKDNMCCCKSV